MQSLKIDGWYKFLAQWKLPKTYEGFLMKSLNDEEDGVLSGYLLSPSEASSAETVLLPIELLAKKVPCKSTNNQGWCQDNRLLSIN